MDNPKFHKSKDIIDNIEKLENKIIYSLSYNASLNPIENLFSQFKNHIKNKNLDNYKELKKSIEYIFKNKIKNNTLELKKDDIIEINTDCFYIKDSNNYDLTKINNNPNDFKDWKTTKGYKKEQLQNFNLKLNENKPDKTKYFYDLHENQYNFNLEYVGGGKTYRIKKQIKNEIKKNNKYSYIILSSFNDFITEYRKDGLNAYTIAHYIYHNKTIKEKIYMLMNLVFVQ